MVHVFGPNSTVGRMKRVFTRLDGTIWLGPTFAPDLIEDVKPEAHGSGAPPPPPPPPSSESLPILPRKFTPVPETPPRPPPTPESLPIVRKFKFPDVPETPSPTPPPATVEPPEVPARQFRYTDILVDTVGAREYAHHLDRNVGNLIAKDYIIFEPAKHRGHLVIGRVKTVPNVRKGDKVSVKTNFFLIIILNEYRPLELLGIAK